MLFWLHAFQVFFESRLARFNYYFANVSLDNVLNLFYLFVIGMKSLRFGHEFEALYYNRGEYFALLVLLTVWVLNSPVSYGILSILTIWH